MGNNNNVIGKFVFFLYRLLYILCIIYLYLFRILVFWCFFFFIRNILGLLGVCFMRWKFLSFFSCFGIVFFCEIVEVLFKFIIGIFGKMDFIFLSFLKVVLNFFFLK